MNYMSALAVLAVVALCGAVCSVGAEVSVEVRVGAEVSAGAQVSVEEEVRALKRSVASLARQALLTQLEIEEKTRQDGDSGIRQVRHGQEGTHAYDSDTHVGQYAVLSMHNHANNIRTIGMGEVAAVLNGVEFRTRHNDYGLRSPSASSTQYQATADIPFPDVPPKVLGKETVEEQTAELREWFRAFRDQDFSERDYRPYFKPVLCYMEGMWTHVSDALDESFESDRHFLNAVSWTNLEDKVRYHAYAGSKDFDENLAYLPRAVINTTEDGLPVFAQWNYEILCHQLNNDLPLDRLRVVDDLHARMQSGVSLAEYEHTRKARFQLNNVDEPFTEDSRGRHSFMDALMYQIPGKDNYGASLSDAALGNSQFMDIDNNDQPLNAAYYHRSYFLPLADSMGRQEHYRGYADEAVYMAMNSQDKVAGMRVRKCTRAESLRNAECDTVDQKWSYAIPLEIIYLSPLSNWNPYSIAYRGHNETSDEYKTVTADGRNGSQGLAFNGTNSKNYYITPHEFYDSGAGKEVETDPSDTTPPGSVYVLDSQGSEKLVRPSGYRVFTPEIEDVGVIRQRYPIAPIFSEGNVIWKELKSVKDVMEPATITGSSPISDDMFFHFRTLPSTATTGSHVHNVTLSAGDIRALRAINNVTVTTEEANGHAHTLVLYAQGGAISRVRYHTCDGKKRCADGHGKGLVFESITSA